MSNITLPTIHSNGTGRHTLERDYSHASDKLHDFTDAFGRIEFNARDYYVQGPDAYTAACTQREDINRKLKEIREYLNAHLDAIF